MSRGPWHVAVLMGGPSSEREVSLNSGKGVADALESRGHRVTRIDLDKDVALKLAEAKPDVVFNALHGVPGEDGSVQGMLDLMGLTYTHSGLVRMLNITTGNGRHYSYEELKNPCNSSGFFAWPCRR